MQGIALSINNVIRKNLPNYWKILPFFFVSVSFTAVNWIPIQKKIRDAKYKRKPIFGRSFPKVALVIS